MVERLLTDPSQTILPSSQSGLLPQRRPCYYGSWEPSQSAASGPQADLALFRHTDENRENTMLSPTETHTCTHLITTGCYAIITHKAFKDGTFRAISSFTNDPRHLWWQSNKHRNFAPMRSAKLMSWITMKTHCFFSTSSLPQWKKTWNPRLLQQHHIMQRGRLFSNALG